MVSKNIILQKLDPFVNTKKIIITNQTVGDIKSGLLEWHNKYAYEYDKIYMYFLGSSLLDSCRNVYNFLKHYVVYNIESEDEQTLRSPAAILAPGVSVGADCKSYALFSSGVMDAINRNTVQKCKVVFRFASYDMFSNIPKHVFCVVNPGTNGIWIDPVLPSFNQKKEPFYYSDKKTNTMSLVAMSGVDDTVNLASGVADIAAPGTGAILRSLASLFKTDYSNDWRGWDAQDARNGQWTPGSTVRGYVLNDGDSVEIEAKNIASYIKANGLQNLTSTGHKVSVPGQGWRDVTIAEIATKLRRGGLVQEANDLTSTFANLFKPGAGGSSTRPVMLDQNGQPVQASMNIWVTLALVGAGIFAISKMKK